MMYHTSELPYARLGIMINKSHAPKAVDRNRMRRIVRESFREKAETLSGMDIIIMVRRGWDKDKVLFKQRISELLENRRS